MFLSKVKKFLSSAWMFLYILKVSKLLLYYSLSFLFHGNMCYLIVKLKDWKKFSRHKLYSFLYMYFLIVSLVAGL